MKRLLVLSLTLALAALAGRADAQPVASGAPATGAPVVVAPANCAPACTQKACVQVPDVIKHSTVVFGCQAKDYCLKGPCGSCDGSCGDCDKCGPRTRRVLLKKVVECETPGYRCEVAEQAVCAPASCSPTCPTGGCGACALPTCRFGQCRRHNQDCDSVAIPAAPVPVGPGQKMPKATGGTVEGPTPAPQAFPTAVQPTQSEAQPLPQTDRR